MSWGKYLLVALIGGMLGTPVFAEDGATVVLDTLKAEIKIGTGVENREPVGVSGTLSSTEKQAVAWTRITGATEPTTVVHVWYRDGKPWAEIPLEVKSSSYRTWSRCSIEGFPGQWRVDVKKPGGEVIVSQDFAVTASPDQSLQP